MNKKHLCAALTAGAVFAVTPTVALADPPERVGTFPVGAELAQELQQAIELTCGVTIASVEGSGTVRFTHFVQDGETVRGQGLFHMTFVVTTSTGTTVTVRERSMDRYTFENGQVVLTTTSGRAVAFVGWIGHLVTTPDGTATGSGRPYDLCAALQ
jgi:hypothetical protein